MSRLSEKLGRDLIKRAEAPVRRERVQEARSQSVHVEVLVDLAELDVECLLGHCAALLESAPGRRAVAVEPEPLEAGIAKLEDERQEPDRESPGHDDTSRVPRERADPRLEALERAVQGDHVDARGLEVEVSEGVCLGKVVADGRLARAGNAGDQELHGRPGCRRRMTARWGGSYDHPVPVVGLTTMRSAWRDAHERFGRSALRLVGLALGLAVVGAFVSRRFDVLSVVDAVIFGVVLFVGAYLLCLAFATGRLEGQRDQVRRDHEVLQNRIWVASTLPEQVDGQPDDANERGLRVFTDRVLTTINADAWRNEERVREVRRIADDTSMPEEERLASLKTLIRENLYRGTYLRS